MILPQTYAVALCLMILSMLCWGSWANTYKASKWRFELYYFDFSVGLLALALILAFTVGSMGFDGFTFLDDMFHAGKRQWFYGFVAGVVFNLANMLLMGAIAVAGMAVAFPVAIGLALIIGVVSNYAIKPAGNPTMIFGGCGLIIAAIIVCATAYRFISNIRHEEQAKAGRAKSTRRPASLKGVIIALVSGVLMGLFYPLIEKGKEGELGLGPYSIAVVFAIGVFLSTLVFNLFFMNLPIEGEPVDFMDYFKGPAQGPPTGIARWRDLDSRGSRVVRCGQRRGGARRSRGQLRHGSRFDSGKRPLGHLVVERVPWCRFQDQSAACLDADPLCPGPYARFDGAALRAPKLGASFVAKGPQRVQSTGSSRGQIACSGTDYQQRYGHKRVHHWRGCP